MNGGANNNKHGVRASSEMELYHDSLQGDFERCYAIAGKARCKGMDPEESVEITPAADVASRVEGLVGPPAIAHRIRELVASTKSREEAVIQIVNEILDGKFPSVSIAGSTEEREVKMEQAVRTGLALYTEGVVSAPIEGMTKVRIKRNADSSEYVSVYFSGPIRGAGGTGQAFTVLLTDYCRVKMGISDYRPTDGEVDRYVEEINLYALRTRAGQYVPSEEEIRHIVRNCAVCIDGEPTEEYEVSVNKNLSNIETNRVRGGMVLVLSEGICLKASKVLSISKKFSGVNWSWIEKLIKVSKAQTSSKIQIKPSDKYLRDIVAGRPIFAYPSRRGAFTLRYGRTRFTGIASKAIHPATMAVLGDFPAIGTQVKIERPGKACVATPCDTINGPIVRLANGDVLRIKTYDEALNIKEQVEKVLFVGDMLVNYGDFLKANHPLVLAGYCEEWYVQELAEAGVDRTIQQAEEMPFEEAFQLAVESKVPLAPRHTLYWHDLEKEQLVGLVRMLSEAEIKDGEMVVGSEEKQLLETIGLEHAGTMVDGKMGARLNREQYLQLLVPLGLLADPKSTTIDKTAVRKLEAVYAESPSIYTLEAINKVSPVKVKHRAGTYIGASMGRPEKSKERRMQPPVHSLFPIGQAGGKLRSVVKAVKMLSNKNERTIQADVTIKMCPRCKVKTATVVCSSCEKRTINARQCNNCNALCVSEKCPKCKGETTTHAIQPIDLVSEFERAVKNTGFTAHEVKGVIGLISADKTPEPLDKGVLRAKHEVYVFRDGTCRVDATEIPITHFKPIEVGTSVEKLRELGYTRDAGGNPLTSEEQVLELKAQDVIISEYAGDYLTRVANFVDDLLVYTYNLPAYYNVNSKQNLIGHLLICIAPHISAGITCRIIGYTSIKGLLAHPYIHCAIRRNCDGDEAGFMLLLDGLLNFSKKFLPASRGGKMDAPLVLSCVLNPSEVDDEVHAMDSCSSYPLAFYRATENNAPPTEVKIETISSRLGKPEQYEGIKYTHEASAVGPIQTAYLSLKDMAEKVQLELDMMLKIRAVDAGNAAERIISSHFFPDLYGNLRSFGKQNFRCVECSYKFRRVPLRGKCNKCGGKIILTINRGGIEKYLELSKQMVQKYSLSSYLKQRVDLVEKDIKSLFEDDKSKQFSLAEYF